jgi:hypothetical protein
MTSMPFLEFDALDDLWQLVFAQELEVHNPKRIPQLGRLPTQPSWGPLPGREGIQPGLSLISP